MSAEFDVFVIGAGVAGMAAAENAVHRNLRVGLAEALMFGGLVVNVNRLQPAPEGSPASGGDLAADMMTRVADLGVETIMAPVTSLERDAAGVIHVVTADGTHSARRVIVATGASLRKLGIPGETELEHRGVAHCADCDGPLYRGEAVVVIGGGDSALQGALVLAQYCSAVHVVHRGETFSGRPEFVQAVRDNPRITVHFRTVAGSIAGTAAVEAVQLRDLASDATRMLPCKGFFAFVGLAPNTDFLPPSVAKLADGGVRVDERLETTLEGVFAIGAARAGYQGQLTDAIDDSGLAVASACDRLRHAS